MRMSCNGCRVLRKGCSDSCTIRPCLEWIKTAESQANATVFLAKFYGRAGLMNLINASAQHLRPAVFRSLLYEACGRIVNPTYGSVGLLWSGNWQICQAAVECILKGCPIHPISGNTCATPPSIIPSENISTASLDAERTSTPRSALMETIARELHKVRSRSRFKSAKKTGGTPPSVGRRNRRELADDGAAPQVCNLRGRRCYPGEFVEPPSLVTVAEPPTNLVSSDSSSESEHRCGDGKADVGTDDRQRTPFRDSAQIVVTDNCRGSTWKRSGMAANSDASDMPSDDVEVELELRLGSPGSSDHDKSISAQCHWSPVASCLDLALTPPSNMIVSREE